MISRSLLTCCLAILVLAAAMLLPAPASAPPASQLLDLTGITLVELRTNGTSRIHFRNDAAPSLILDDRDVDVQVTRDGHRLLVVTTGDSYFDVTLTLPPTVSTLQVDYTNVTAESPVETLEIQASGNLDWSGNARRLVLVDTSPELPPESVNADADARPACGEECGVWFSINDGQIGQLDVRLKRGKLDLDHADDIGQARLRLGPEAEISLDGATRLDHIHVEPDAGATPIERETEALQ